MKMRTFPYLFLLLTALTPLSLSGQMVLGQDTLIGNEWISYGQVYYKFTVSQDGIYRITGASLQSAGIDLNQVKGSQIQIYSLGQQIPVFVSTDDAFSTTDYIEFYGHRNRSEMDRFLYMRPDEDILNPDHSLYTDHRAYYLTWDGNSTPSRVTMLPNDITNPPAPDDYYLHKEALHFSTFFQDPYNAVTGGNVTYSSYMHAEGFCSGLEVSHTSMIPVTDLAPGGPDASFHLRMSSANLSDHLMRISWNGQPLFTMDAFNLEILDTTITIPLAQVQTNNTILITCDDPQRRLSVVSMSLTYPRMTNAQGQDKLSIIIPDHPSGHYYVLENFDHGHQTPLLYSTDGQYRMEGALNAQDQLHFLWPALATDQEIVVVHPGQQIQLISQLHPITFTDFGPDDTEYVIITHPDLMTIGTGSEWVQYRSSSTGGGYRAKAYSILDLYDQFGYGIEKHPQAVRNFVEFMHRQWPSTQMIFLVGRGIEYQVSRYENGMWEHAFFVPTFGRPGADNLLAATLWDLVPRYPIGRLAAMDSDAVAMYLQKVQEYESAITDEQTPEAKTWIKNVVHIAGGKTADEQSSFKATLDELGAGLAASDFGARITHFQKESSDIIDESQSKQIEKLFNEGCSIINYLGHSSPSTFEFDIVDPSQWNNAGRYPVFSGMGCSAGQIHNPFFSLSDRYVQLPNEGAIAFVSGSGSQFPAALITWAQPWYEHIGILAYGAPLGQSILHGLRGVANYVNPQFPGHSVYRYLLEQQTLQGDPAIRINPLPGPDYIVDRTSVRYSPPILSTKTDSLDLSFRILNLGRNLRQTVAYKISVRNTQNEILDLKTATVYAGLFENDVSVKLPLEVIDQPGIYRLLIEVDPGNEWAELPAPQAESNNRLVDNLGVEGISLVISDNIMTAAYPPDFAIIGEPILELIATGSNAFQSGMNVIMEIDTNALFNSPFRVREKLTDQLGLVKWSPPITLIPGQEYFWRVSLDSLSSEQGYVWSTRSFIFIPAAKPGWNQSHFHQWTDNGFDQIKPDSAHYNYRYQFRFQNFSMLNRVQDNDLELNPIMRVDNIIRAAYFTGFVSQNINVFVVAIDSFTGEIMRNPNPGLYGSHNHLAFDAPCFAFRTDLPEHRQALIDFVENIIPDGHFVFFYTYQRPGFMDYYPEQWEADEDVFGKSIFSLIESEVPTSQIRSLATTGSLPYAVLFQKGKGLIEEHIAQDPEEVIAISFDSPISLDSGRVTSTLVGPASRWYSMHYQPMADSMSAQFTISARAYSANFADTLMISNHWQYPDTLLSGLEATEYPYLDISMVSEDSLSYQPAELNYWRVHYDGIPDLIVDPQLDFEFIADTLFQGEIMRLRTTIGNLGHDLTDSIDVALKIIAADNSTIQLDHTLPPMPHQAFVPVEFTYNTKDLAGDYQVVMEINPGRIIPESLYDNNIGILSMHVLTDHANPVLDVTFDGFRIQDGDVVAAFPLIEIHLQDENDFLRLTDTSLFMLHLTYPSDITSRPVYFSQPWVEFIPAAADGINRASVQLRPALTEDGIYTLRVQARDATGNESGDLDYFVSFEVIHHRAISHIYNFPNPFNRTTRFGYTLTGDGSPAYYKIQIVSVLGRIEREITQDELGPMAVGSHVMEYEWDGTDAYGHPLPMGIYFYRMITRDENDREYDRYPLGFTDQWFKNGWGKLVIQQ
jgi:hypothetical protein